MSETIINGIDVSECNIRFNHFGKNICELGNRKLGELHYLCSENPNCYFKQLKRLQEENEKLKKALQELEDLKDLDIFTGFKESELFGEELDEKKHRVFK